MMQDSHQANILPQNTLRVFKEHKQQLRNRLTVSKHAGSDQQSFHAQEHNNLGQVELARCINDDGVRPISVHRCMG